MKKLLLVLALLLSGISSAFSQDTLYTRSGEKRLVKVTEIGLEEIKYSIWGLESGPVVVIAKSDVKKIAFSNGQTMEINMDPMSLESVQQERQDKKQAIKVEFFSLLTNDLAFGYERVVRPGLNVEGKLGIIGVGFAGDMPRAGGLFVKAGAKYWSGKDYYVRGMKMSHPLRGAYIKPEIIFSQFWQDQDYTASGSGAGGTVRVNYTNIAANICFGKQVLLGNNVTMDWYIGLGYGWQGSDADDKDLDGIQDVDFEWEPYAYSHTYSGPDFPLIISGGLTLGIMF